MHIFVKNSLLCIEDINNQLYIFPILLHYIKIKGHTYTIKDEKPLKILESLLAEDIINADNIDDEMYQYLLVKQKEGIITQKERMSIEKYLYSKVFKVEFDDITISFMKTHYGKLNIVKNNREFTDYIIDGRPEEFNNDLNKFDNQNKYQKMEYIKQIINALGYDDINKKVAKETFEKNVDEMIKIIDSKFRTLFDMKKEEVDKISKKYDTNKKILGFINKLISDYGIEIKASYKRIYNKDTKKMRNRLNGYILSNLKIINL